MSEFVSAVSPRQGRIECEATGGIAPDYHRDAVQWGERVRGHLASARQRVDLIAPFIKYSILELLLSTVDPRVAVTVTTRWHMDEISGGISDIGVWELIRSRPETHLYLCSNLHTKLYRSDDSVLVGSANLTSRALAICNNPNFEVLVEVPLTMPEIGIAMTEVRAARQEVDESLYQAYLQLVDLEFGSRGLALVGSPERNWFPTLHDPMAIWQALRKGENDSVRLAATSDLRGLGINASPDTQNLEALIAVRFRQTDLVKCFEQYCADGACRRFGEVRRWVSRRLNLGKGTAATNATQTMINWLRMYHGEQFIHSRPAHSELVRFTGSTI